MSWTDERVEKLKALWADGMTASSIARELGGVSRNAVIGKVHRLGLSNRSGGGKESMAPEAPPPEVRLEPPVEPPAAPMTNDGRGSAVSEDVELSEVEASPAKVESEEVVAAVDSGAPENPVARLAAEVERSARKLSLLELNERTCKWPIGDPSTDDFYFCGLPCAPDKPYCEAHVAVAYQPMSSRRDREVSRRRSAG